MNFIQALEKELLAHRNAENAIKMEAYMKDNFPYLGIKIEQSRIIFKTTMEKT